MRFSLLMSSSQGNARETSDVELDSRGQHTMDQIQSVYTPVCTHHIFQLPSDEFPKNCAKLITRQK